MDVVANWQGMSMSESKYDGSDIQVFASCVERVQKRPAMYACDLDDATGLLREAMCVPLDNLLTDHATALDITLHSDGRVVVADNGPGWPLETHRGRTVTEIIFTQLHAGCRLHKHDLENSKYCSDGIVCTNALSLWLTVDNRRDGFNWHTRFENGVVTGPAVNTGPVDSTGLTIAFHPDPSYFQDGLVSISKFVSWFRELDLSLGSDCRVTVHQPEVGESLVLFPIQATS